MDSSEYCRELAAPAGSSLYYATLFYRPEEKQKLLGVFALLTELNKTVIHCQDPGVARIKLQWWVEELDRLYLTQARHPVSKLIQTFVNSSHLEQRQLQQLVQLAENEINPLPVNSLSSLIESKAHSHGHGWRLADSLISSNPNQPRDLLNKLAGLYSSIETMQTAAEKLHRGYCVFPEDLMNKHDLRPDDLLNLPLPAQTACFLKDIFDFLHSELDATLNTLPDKMIQLPTFAFCLSLIARAKCNVLRNQSDPRALQNANITPLKKLWLSWKAKRKSA
ncbi:MAG: hypothetical protein GKR93_18940 [Gammaproteobacteria bacterium]|nr:hypothetical protein [Gammaproteobacteria bacterium]